MPNGYTAPIYEGEDISFRDFILRCARGFGFAVGQRDEPMDAPLKTYFEPNTKYHDDALKKAWATLERVDAMSDAELEQEAQERYEAGVRAHEEAAEKTAAMAERYDAMIEKVEAWPVPGELAEMKKTILGWLRESREHDAGRVYPSMPERQTGAELREELRERAMRDIAYHVKSRQEEIDRTEERNAYARLLLDSLDGVPA